MFTRSDSKAANGSTTATLTAGSEATGRTLPAEYRTPRDLLRACVAATKEVDAAEAVLDAAIERQVDLEDAIGLMMESAGVEAVSFNDGLDYWVVTRIGGAISLTPAALPTSLSLGALLPEAPAPARYRRDEDISDAEFEEMFDQVKELAARDMARHPFARLIHPIPDEHDAELIASFALPMDGLDDASPGPGYGDDVDTGEYPTLAALGVDVAVIDQEAS